MTSHLPIEVAPEEAARLLRECGDVMLLDCRTDEERHVASLAGARFLSMQELPARLEELEPARDRPIVVYCHHGVRSRRVAAFLRERGFARATSLAGGIDRWSIEIDPTVPRY